MLARKDGAGSNDVVHRVWCEIQTVRPSHDSVFDECFGEDLGIAELREYAGVRAEDHRANNHLYLLRENKEKLRNRIDSGVRLDHDMRVHLVAGVQGSNGLASANFMMLRNGALTYSGQYHVSFERGDKIRHCNAVVNDSGLDLLYLPI